MILTIVFYLCFYFCLSSQGPGSTASPLTVLNRTSIAANPRFAVAVSWSSEPVIRGQRLHAPEGGMKDVFHVEFGADGPDVRSMHCDHVWIETVIDALRGLSDDVDPHVWPTMTPLKKINFW